MSEPWQDWDDYCDRLDEKEHNARMEDYELAQDKFEVLVKLLYSKEPLDANTLDYIMSDLADALQVESKLMQHLPTVQRVGKQDPVIHKIDKELIK